MLLLYPLLFASSWALVLQTSRPSTTDFVELLPRETSTSVPTTTSAPTGTFLSTKYITVGGVTNSHVTVPAKTIEITIPTCVQTIVPDANGFVPPGTCHALYKYYPSFAAALVFALLFVILTIAHVWEAITYKKGFCWVIIMASLWETLAFIFRTISTRFQQSSGIYLISQLFILLAPLWVNAFDYMVLGRMIHFFLPSRTIFSIPASTIAAIFVMFDVVAFAIQLVGGTIAGPLSSPQDQLKAVHIYMGGIGLQQFFIVVFMALALKFQFEMTAIERMGQHVAGRGKWRPLLYTMYASLTFITIRIIFRFVEMSSGKTNKDNPMLSHEAYFYALEAVPMFLAILSFTLIHPGTVLVGPGSKMPGFIATTRDILRRRSGKKLLLMDNSDTEDQKYDGAELRQLPERR